MAHLSKVTLRFTMDDLPLLPEIERYAKAGLVTGGGKRNEEYFGSFVKTPGALKRWQAELLYDPQTSGPLLAAVDPTEAVALVAAFRAAGEPVWIVGEAVAGSAGGIEIA
jgi:selenide,water dikinase